MMADNKENMDPVTHQLSAVDNDMHKGADVQEKTVASVALGMSKQMTLSYLMLMYRKLLLLRLRNLISGRGTCFNCT